MSVAKQSAVVLTVGWLLTPFNIITSIFVARAIGPEGKGALMLMSGLLAIVASLSGLGLSSSSAFLHRNKRYSVGQLVAGSLFVSLLTSVVITIVFFAFSDVFISVFVGATDKFKAENIWLIITFAMLLPSLASSVGEVLILVDGNMKLYSSEALSNGITATLLTWLLVILLNKGVAGALTAQLAGCLVQAGFIAYWAGKNGVFSDFKLKRQAVNDLVRIGLQQYGVSLVAMIAKRFDAFLIAGLLTIREAGYFSIAFMVFSMFMTLPRSTTWPLVSKLAGSNDRNDVLQFAAVTRILTAALFLSMIVVAAVTPLAIKAFFGERFMPAVPAVWGVLPAIVFSPLIISGIAYFTSKGMPGKLIVPSIVVTALQISVALTLVPRIGIVGSSLGLSASQVTLGAWMLLSVSRRESLGIAEMALINRSDLATIKRKALGIICRRKAG